MVIILKAIEYILSLLCYHFSALVFIKRRTHHTQKRFDLAVDNNLNNEDLHNVGDDECDAYLASGSYDGTLSIWNLNTRACIKSIKAHSPHRLSALAVSTDGLTLVSVGWDCKIHVSLVSYITTESTFITAGQFFFSLCH